MITTLTQENYIEELSKHRIAVVKMYAHWCGACRFMISAYKRYAETYKDYNGEAVPFFEIDYDTNPEFVKKFEIGDKGTALPSIMFFIYGILVYKIEGITQTKVFESTLDKTLQVEYSKEDVNENEGL